MLVVSVLALEGAFRPVARGRIEVILRHIYVAVLYFAVAIEFNARDELPFVLFHADLDGRRDKDLPPFEIFVNKEVEVIQSRFADMPVVTRREIERFCPFPG